MRKVQLVYHHHENLYKIMADCTTACADEGIGVDLHEMHQKFTQIENNDVRVSYIPLARRPLVVLLTTRLFAGNREK